jgi:hypothetical protein
LIVTKINMFHICFSLQLKQFGREAGIFSRMQGTRMVKAIYCWKPISRRPIGRPKIRWVDDVRKDIQKLKVPIWKTLAQDIRRWK